MPRVGIVQTTNFPELLSRLGINRNQIPFQLESTVMPVALVDSGVDFVASPGPAYRITDINTAGVLTAPAANTVLADSGPLPAGGYTVTAIIYAEEANEVDLEWRNAADTANLVAVRFQTPTARGLNTIFVSRFNIENANERFRLFLPVAGGVGVQYQGALFTRI